MKQTREGETMFEHHHYKTSGGEIGVEYSACREGIALLNTSKGSEEMKPAELREEWRHLADHLRKAGETPEPLLGVSADGPEAGSEFKAIDFKGTEFKRNSDGLFTEAKFFASVFGNIDSDGEIVVKGAFSKTIKERVPAGLVKLVDSHQWNCQSIIGTVTKAEETDHGLLCTVAISAAASAQEVALKASEGHISQCSFAFRIIHCERGETEDERSCLMLTELKLLEVTWCMLGANPATTIESVKACVPFQGFQLAPLSHKWNASEAVGRIKDWSGGGNLNLARYRRAFLWYDAHRPDLFESYRFPLIDVVQGRPMAVPRAIFHAAEAIENGASEIPSEDETGCRGHLETYFERMSREFGAEVLPPWKGFSLFDLLLDEATAEGLEKARSVLAWYEKGLAGRTPKGITPEEMTRLDLAIAASLDGSSEKIVKKVLDACFSA